MQSTTYTLYGLVIITYCYWSVFENDCIEEPEEYIEWDWTQATVQPQPAPSISNLSSGSGTVGSALTIYGANFTGTQEHRLMAGADMIITYQAKKMAELLAK